MMKWPFLIPFALLGCAAAPTAPVVPESSAVVFEVHRQPRQCPPLPKLADNANGTERAAFTRTVVMMYAQCAKGDE